MLLLLCGKMIKSKKQFSAAFPGFGSITLNLRMSSSFVPRHAEYKEYDLKVLQEFINKFKKRILVLTGAGISTESGIPDYRSEGVGLYTRTNHKPVQYKSFIEDAQVRNRYWLRNFISWPQFSSFSPNATHEVIAKWENEFHWLTLVVTQNVDRLHKKAGSRNVVELHGSGYEVSCFHCGLTVCRHRLQERMVGLNPDIHITPTSIRPDGDVDLPNEMIEGFIAPLCEGCGGFMKPDIVFFGDNVPTARVDYVSNILKKSAAIFILGSSLEVFSGYRFALQAKDQGKPIVIVNIGPTRADDIATIKISARCGDILPRVRAGN